MGSKTTFRRYHPGGGSLGRCSYGVPGVPGIIVIDMSLFKDGKAPTFITLDVELAQPKAPKVEEVKVEAPAAEAPKADVKAPVLNKTKAHGAKVG